MSDRSSTMTPEQRVASALEAIEMALTELLARAPPTPRPRPQPLASEQVLLTGDLTDGSATIAAPNWQHLQFSSLVTTGSETIDSNGNLVVTNHVPADIEWRITVQQTKGTTIYFGYSWDAGPVQQLASSATLNSNNPLVFSSSDSIDMSVGTTLALYLSSNNNNAATVWSNSEITFLQAPPEVPPTDAHYIYLSGQWNRRDGDGVQASVGVQEHVVGSPPIGTQLDPWVKRDVPMIDGEDNRAEPPVSVNQ